LTETELRRLLDDHDALVQRCVSGRLSLDEFLRQYDNFPFAYALDGHESDQDEKDMLRRHAKRIGFHLGVMKSLSGLCSEEEAKNPLYIKAGRFPPSVALQRLKAFAQEYAQSDG
jgi:hypothetical protein